MQLRLGWRCPEYESDGYAGVLHNGYAPEFCNAIAVDMLQLTRPLFRLLHRVLAAVTRLDYRKPTCT
jgi:hypothetical protein